MVIVTVVCEEEKCTATVADIEKVVKAVLTPDQQELVNGGETIEIRIDVTDISEKVPARDKEVIASGIEAYREEVPGLVLGKHEYRHKRHKNPLSRWAGIILLSIVFHGEHSY